MHSEAAIREPLILGHKTYSDITNDIVSPIENKAPRGWYVLITISALIAAYGVGCILYLLGKGIEAKREDVGQPAHEVDFSWAGRLELRAAILRGSGLCERCRDRKSRKQCPDGMPVFSAASVHTVISSRSALALG